jgi:hypothetical protein
MQSHPTDHEVAFSIAYIAISYLSQKRDLIGSTVLPSCQSTSLALVGRCFVGSL